MNGNGHWQYPADINIDDWFGFIYRIVEISTGREYIGKKQFHSYTRKVVPGKKNRKRVVKESNWKSYTGSSKNLNAAIKENGIENYSFYIESLHETKGSLFYAEVEKQVTEDVLRATLDNGEKKFFNGFIAGVKFIPPVVTTNESHTNIDNYIISEEYKTKFGGEGSLGGTYGIPDVKKGLTYEEYYGEERAAQIKAKLSGINTGKENTMRGVNFHTPEQKEKWKTDKRRRHLGEDNGMYGKPCFYKMTDEEKEQWKKNIGDSLKGLKRSDDTKTKMKESWKQRERKKTTCPHCNKTGGVSNMTRYHFDNCKLK